MVQIDISEIQDKKTKRDKAAIGMVFLFLIMISSFLIFLSRKYEIYNDYLAILFVFGLLLLFIMDNYIYPTLSSYENIRYYSSELVASLTGKDLKKARIYLDKLAFNIYSLNDEIEDIPILNYAKSILFDFWLVLKYEIYPNLSNREKMNTLTVYLEQIDNAISNDNINNLSSIIKSLKREDYKNSNIVLPYEKEPIINHFFKKLKRFISINFTENIFFRFILLFIFLILLTNFFYPIDINVIFWLGTISAALAAGYKQNVKS